MVAVTDRARDGSECDFRSHNDDDVGKIDRTRRRGTGRGAAAYPETGTTRRCLPRGIAVLRRLARMRGRDPAAFVCDARGFT